MYYFYLSKIQEISQRDKMLGLVGRGRWPGGTRSWGNHRVWLYPMSYTNTYERSGFTIHGGKIPGSSGCIDLVEKVEPFFIRLNYVSIKQDRIELRVSY